MVTKLDGMFVMESFGPVTDQERRNLLSMITNLYNRGDLLDIQVSIKKVGSRPLCDKQNKYGRCQGVLKFDGMCPEQDRHVEEEAEEAA